MTRSSIGRLLTEIDPLEVVRECEENYIDYWRSATWASPSEWSEQGGIVRCITGLYQEIFNVVLYCKLGAGEVSAKVDQMIDDFRARKIPLIWHVGLTSSPSNLGSILEAKGHPKDYELIAMACDLSGDVDTTRHNDAIAVKKCSSAKDHNDWISCLTGSWDSPAGVGDWMRANPFFSAPLDKSLNWPSARTMYLGLLENVPSGAVMLLESRGVSGLQCVGTVKSSQKKGVGEALVRAAKADAARKGHRFLVVLSTEEGVPLYRKTGFKRFGTLPEHGMYFDRPAP